MSDQQEKVNIQNLQNQVSSEDNNIQHSVQYQEKQTQKQLTTKNVSKEGDESINQIENNNLVVEKETIQKLQYQEHTQRIQHEKEHQLQNNLKNEPQNSSNEINSSIIPLTPLQLQQIQQENIQKQRLIYQILRMHDDFQRLQIRSQQLQQENHYFINKIQQYQKIIYQDVDQN